MTNSWVMPDSLLITAHVAKRAKVMFSQECVTHFVQERGKETPNASWDRSHGHGGGGPTLGGGDGLALGEGGPGCGEVVWPWGRGGHPSSHQDLPHLWPGTPPPDQHLHPLTSTSTHPPKKSPKKSPPPQEVAQQEVTPPRSHPRSHPPPWKTENQGIRSMSRWYASYWNAFLL